MSQVIVTHDNLDKRRVETRKQEHHISTETAFAHWRMSSVTGKDPIKTLAGLAFLPIAAFWAFVMACMGLALAASSWVFRLLGGSNSKK